MKCKIHYRYKARRAPKRTKKFPNGCPVCVKIYEDKIKAEEKSQREWECEQEIWKEACRIADKPD